MEWWRTTFRKLRNQDGINTIRFHSWTPPKAAFDAADELGMFCVVEAGIWVDRWHTTADKMGFGKPIDGFVQHELRNILEKRGNSPSFISLGIGNELGGSDFKVMGKWMNDCRAFDPSRLYLASTAREISPGDDYTTTHRHPEVGMVRGRFRPSTDWDYEDVYGKTRLPVVAHEIGQWPIYVDWKHELAKYTGQSRTLPRRGGEVRHRTLLAALLQGFHPPQPPDVQGRGGKLHAHAFLRRTAAAERAGLHRTVRGDDRLAR